ncbi:serine/threonine-protein kinase [Singulisphaera sp. PoT]|uniref:serine/threonine-protein kinase n=1 Tax=Singulisphaera sp. PoT TaxID=3411797 RepID=UPI003BF524F8
MNVRADRCDTARLALLLEGRLPGADEPALVAHLDACRACQRRLDELAAEAPWWGALRRLDDAVGPSATDRRGGCEQEKRACRGMRRAAGKPGDEALGFLAPSEDPGCLGRLGHFRVDEVLGRGGMGVVLRAFDEVLDRAVAIKVLAPQLATGAAARRRFDREARAAAAVVHEHVTAIHAVSVDDRSGLPYLVMPYVAGGSLQERIDRDGPLAAKEILRIGMQAAAGLAAAHAQGLVHRDVKPSNILLEDGMERVKLTDFGLARATDDASLTQSGVVTGTPQYMSPEQARGGPIDARSDLFSLGSVLYAMAAGRPPFLGESPLAVLRRVSDEHARALREIDPEVPGWLAAVVEKLHAKEPADRYQSAAEVSDLLGSLLADLQGGIPPRHRAPSGGSFALRGGGNPGGRPRLLRPRGHRDRPGRRKGMAARVHPAGARRRGRPIASLSVGLRRPTGHHRGRPRRGARARTSWARGRRPRSRSTSRTSRRSR